MDKAALAFRSALIAGDFARAAQLAADYVEAIRTQWECMSEDERRASLLPLQSQELLNWARDVALVQQALTREHLALLGKASRYQPSFDTEPRPHALQVRA